MMFTMEYVQIFVLHWTHLQNKQLHYYLFKVVRRFFSLFLKHFQLFQAVAVSSNYKQTLFSVAVLFLPHFQSKNDYVSRDRNIVSVFVVVSSYNLVFIK